MRPTVTNQVVWSVGLSVTLVSPAKTAEPIEMLFGLWAQLVIEQRKHAVGQSMNFRLKLLYELDIMATRAHRQVMPM